MYKVGDEVVYIGSPTLHYDTGDVGIIIREYDSRNFGVKFEHYRHAKVIRSSDLKLKEETVKGLTRQEALIEIMKGSVVVTQNEDRIYVSSYSLMTGHPEIRVRRCGGFRDKKLENELCMENEPFFLAPKTRTISLDGKSFEISEDSFQAFKKQFLED